MHKLNCFFILIVFIFIIPFQVCAKIDKNNLNTLQLEAAKYIENSQYKKALKLINKAIELYPEKPSNYALRGQIYANLSNHESSISDFTKAIELTKFQDKYPQEVSSYYLNRANSYYDLDQIWQSVDDLKKALAFNAKNSDVFYMLANIYSKKLNDNQSALKNIDTAIDLAPNITDYIRLRAKIYDDLGQFDNAKSELNHLIALDPKSYENYYEMGCLLLKHNQNGQEYFDKATKIAPQNFKLFDDIGGQLNLYGDNVKALEYFDKSLKIKPTASGYLGKALIYDNRLINYQKALKNIKLSIELNPYDEASYWLEGYIYLHLNQDQNAKAAFNKAVEISPHISRSYLELGELYLKEKNDKLAKYNFDKATYYAQGPEKYEVYFKIGLSYHLSDYYSEAIKYYDESIKLKPTAKAYFNRGILTKYCLCQTDKNYDEAIKYFYKAFELNPDDIKALELIVVINYNNSNYKEVINAVNKYFKNHKEEDLTNCTILFAYSNSMLKTPAYDEDGEKIVKFLNKVVSLNPDFPNIHYHLGEAYYLAFDGKCCSKAYDEFKLDILHAKPNDSSIGKDYLWIGKLITRLNIKENALDYINKGVKLYPNKNLTYVTLSQYYTSQLKFKEAIKLLNKADNLEPINNYIINQKIVTYFLAEQYDESFQICKNNIDNKNDDNLRLLSTTFGFLNLKYLNQPDKAKQWISKFLECPQTDDCSKTLFKYLCGTVSKDDLLVKLKKHPGFTYIFLLNIYLNENQKYNELLEIILNNEDPNDLKYFCAQVLAKKHNIPIPCRYQKSN